MFSEVKIQINAEHSQCDKHLTQYSLFLVSCVIGSVGMCDNIV